MIRYLAQHYNSGALDTEDTEYLSLVLQVSQDLLSLAAWAFLFASLYQSTIVQSSLPP